MKMAHQEKENNILKILKVYGDATQTSHLYIRIIKTPS
jgi:hypothetical protein